MAEWAIDEGLQKTMKSPVICFVLMAGFSAPVQSELVLDAPLTELKPKPEDEEVTTSFLFRNAGDQPVKILSIKSACECLSAKLDKTVYKPGEQGKGEAVFRVPGSVGRHEKSIRVTTDDPRQRQWQIPFVLEVEALVEIEPAMSRWWVGDAEEPKTISVKIRGESPMKVLKVTSTRENVDISFKEVKPGREYWISVTPTSTEAVTFGILKIELDGPFPKHRNQLAYFSIFNKSADTKP